jgi:DNA gyrase subunit B
MRSVSCRGRFGRGTAAKTCFHPLRGKILNVEKAMHHKVFENEEIRNIFTALGVTVGTAEDSKALNMDKLRYHKVLCVMRMSMEPHIYFNINILFRFMRELLKKVMFI